MVIDDYAYLVLSFFVRWLTHLHVYSVNLWLLAAPATLSYDWQMGSIPLVESWIDCRNLATVAFLLLLLALAALVVRLMMILGQQVGGREHKTTNQRGC